MKKHLTTILLVVIMTAGLGLVLYPTVSDYYNSFHRSVAISSYASKVEEMDDSVFEPMWAAANGYNEYLKTKSMRFYLTDEERAYYNTLLDATGMGIIGYVEIPTLNVNLPFYHGTSTDVLQVAIGHIEGSSLPTGEPGTHTALSGHRGLPSATLFTNLDKLREGDIFTVYVLNREFTYEIDKISIVLPKDMTELELIPGENYCTLTTCTPYGINSHRLLVRGRRVVTPEKEVIVRVASDATLTSQYTVAVVIAAMLLLLILIYSLLCPKRG